MGFLIQFFFEKGVLRKIQPARCRTESLWSSGSFFHPQNHCLKFSWKFLKYQNPEIKTWTFCNTKLINFNAVPNRWNDKYFLGQNILPQLEKYFHFQLISSAIKRNFDCSLWIHNYGNQSPCLQKAKLKRRKYSKKFFHWFLSIWKCT